MRFAFVPSSDMDRMTVRQLDSAIAAGNYHMADVEASDAMAAWASLRIDYPQFADHTIVGIQAPRPIVKSFEAKDAVLEALRAAGMLSTDEIIGELGGPDGDQVVKALEHLKRIGMIGRNCGCWYIR